MSVTWITPTSHSGGSGWTDHAQAYDEDTGTRASVCLNGYEWTSWLNLILPSAVQAASARFFVNRSDNYISGFQCDVYKDDQWVNVYSIDNHYWPGDLKGVWKEVAFDQGSVSQIRFRFKNYVSQYYDCGYVYETQVGAVPESQPYAFIM
jgi:hypothetical protein